MDTKDKRAKNVLPKINDNGVRNTELQLYIISQAIGHHIARQPYLAWEKKQRRAANDNSPATLGEEIKGQGPKG